MKVNTLVRLKSDQVEQTTHKNCSIILCLFRVAEQYWRVQMIRNRNCLLFVNCVFTRLTKPSKLNCQIIGPWVLELRSWFIATKSNRLTRLPKVEENDQGHLFTLAIHCHRTKNIGTDEIQWYLKRISSF